MINIMVMGTALITGATSGIGEEFCWQLAAAHHDLVIVARTEHTLNALAEHLRQVAAIRVEVIPADLGEPADLARVATRCALRHKERDEEGHLLAPIGLLVNNAGFGLGKPFLDGDFDRELYAMDVMVRAVMALSYEAGLAMRERGRGAILNVSSIAAELPGGTYSAHKAWVKAFSESLSSELKGSGVTVTAVCPGLTHTNFHAAARTDMSAAPSWSWLTSEQVVSEALDAVRLGRVIVTPSIRYKVASEASKVAPRSLVRAIMRRIPHQ